LECAFDVVGKILMSQDLMEFILVRFGFRMLGDIDFLSDFCHLKIQIKFQKTRFWKEKIQLRMW